MSIELKAFLLRVWNTVKYPLVSIFLGVLGKIIGDVSEVQTLSILTNWTYWDSIAVTLLQLVGAVLGVGTMSGADKVLRMKK